ncbi:unnamed protein product [Albugo candida]|uniref:Uncharacterized protein n=1 Tax=Albugo candida TaxID=65357 RepID=A0A024FXI9_9STRA|nr:unnamed protein product [Albugo candida]|eukprot:CCI11374.1 unnamed protein product [Albugo candida]
MCVQLHYKFGCVPFHITSVWYHVVTVSLRPIGHVVTKTAVQVRSDFTWMRVLQLTRIPLTNCQKTISSNSWSLRQCIEYSHTVTYSRVIYKILRLDMLQRADTDFVLRHFVLRHFARNPSGKSYYHDKCTEADRLIHDGEVFPNAQSVSRA